jgi:hypothetical protein
MSDTIKQMMAVPAAGRGIDWLKKALQAAIELELSTLPPYLCAMWSIRDPGSPSGGAAYTLIDTVVQQEMIHMGFVCNLLTAIGGTPIIAAGYAKNIIYPGPLPGDVRPGLTVYLSGLTKTYLHDVMMQIEFPEAGPIHFALVAEEVFPTIGDFYDAILRAFQDKNPPLSAVNQLESFIGVTKILKPKDVEDAIKLIKEQGEGTSTSPLDGGSGGELAHFYRFAELYVGATLKAGADGKFKFQDPAIPFPDTITMAPIPKGGYQNVATGVRALLDAFNSLFSQLLDSLDKAWRTGDNDELEINAVGLMRQLAGAAAPIFQQPLPLAVDGFYGPDFRYIPAAQRTGGGHAAAADPMNPTFSDITALLKALTGDDPNIGHSPHRDFWTMDYDHFMAQTTNAWGAPGKLAVPGDVQNSILYRALAGLTPFGATIRRMPDTIRDTNGRFATPAELDMVAKWITNNCPK